jgi:glycosyltransferase involved in cell wall biosynthesis
VNIAFYAPMKSPHHPNPSGDRRIARLLIKALQTSGHKVEVISDLRSWEGKGDAAVQQIICEQAFEESERLLENINNRPADQQPDIWFSYHLYHKAPDWIGPRLADQLNIPYVVAEASLALKQARGAWPSGLHQVIHALDQAAAIICLNPVDIPALQSRPGLRAKLHPLMPFIDSSEIKSSQTPQARNELARQYGLDPALPWLVSVAMMRDDAKLASYQYLVKTLARVNHGFELLLVGDGRARHKVEALFSGKLAKSTHYAGELDQAATLDALSASDLFVWPAVNEAIGMAILEAQACGLPVVAGASGAIPELVQEAKTGFLCAPDNTQLMAASIEQLLEQPEQRRQFSLNAIENIKQHHSLRAAANTLEHILSSVVPG